MTSTTRPAGAVGELPRLVQITVEPDGASMSCHYCLACVRIDLGDVDAQIVRFQERHFGCDPALAVTDRLAGTGFGAQQSAPSEGCTESGSDDR